MNILRQERTIDRTNWLSGEWDNEPDLIEWRDEATGLACLIVRARFNLCGYVGVPHRHPMFGKEYDSVDVEVHGGLTFGGSCHGRICHTPQAGEGEVWWFGFDCAHAFDYSSGHYALTLRCKEGLFMPQAFESYRNVAYVTGEVTNLARQLAQLGPNPETKCPTCPAGMEPLLTAVFCEHCDRWICQDCYDFGDEHV